MSLLGRVYHTGGKAQRFKLLIIYQCSWEFGCLEAGRWTPQCKRKAAAMPLHSGRSIASLGSALPVSSHSLFSSSNITYSPALHIACNWLTEGHSSWFSRDWVSEVAPFPSIFISAGRNWTPTGALLMDHLQMFFSVHSFCSHDPFLLKIHVETCVFASEGLHEKWRSLKRVPFGTSLDWHPLTSPRYMALCFYKINFID